MSRIALILLLVTLQGCSTGSIVKGVLSSAVGGGPSASLDVQVGDDKVAEGATIGSSTSQHSSKIETIVAQKDSKVDQSTKKKDQKTEIGEVKGNVSVQQGTPAFGLFLLGAGWPIFVAYLIYTLFRRKPNGGEEN